MNDQPDAECSEKHAERDGTPSHVSKPGGRQKANQRAEQAYKTAKRLAKRLQETAGRLTTSELIAAVLTAVIAGATTWNVVVVQRSIGVLRGQLDEMRAEQRAWVVPELPIAAAGPKSAWISITIPVRNVGREPAIDAHGTKATITPTSPPLTTSTDYWLSLPIWAAIGKERPCSKNASIGTEILYPGLGNRTGDMMETIRDNEDISLNQIFDGTRFIIIFGCINYKTFGAMHYSSFCYFIKPSADKILSEWRSIPCPVLNDAN